MSRPELSYRELVEQMPAVLYVDASDETSSALYVSPQTDSMFGYSRGEWLEDTDLWVKILHPEDRERVLAEHDQSRWSGGPFESEYRLVARDGSVVWVRDEATLVGGASDGPERRARVLMDITERKRYQEKLRNSEECFRLVAAVTGEAIWDNDLLTGTQVWDGATEALFGYPPHAGRTGAWWEERIHPEDRDRVLSGLRDVLDGEGEAWEEEYHFRRANGSYAFVLDRGRVVRNPDGEPVRMVGAMKDITERQRHENEMRMSEERFRTTFEATVVGMAHVSADGRWLKINDKLCEISGYSREELMHITFLDIVHPDELEDSRKRMRGMLTSKHPKPYSVERRYLCKDGRRIWVGISVTLAYEEPSGRLPYFVCSAEDVTGRRLKELVPKPLTERELEVLKLATRWHTDRDIARKLGYCVGTIKADIGRVLRKLGVKGRRQAARKAVEIGLIAPPR